MQLSYRDCQVYENFFDAALKRMPTEAQFLLDAKWRAAHPNAKTGEGARLNAQEYERLTAELSNEEGKDAERKRHLASAPAALASPGDGAAKKVTKTPMKNARNAVKQASGAVPLKKSASKKQPPALGIDAGDIR